MNYYFSDFVNNLEKAEHNFTIVTYLSNFYNSKNNRECAKKLYFWLKSWPLIHLKGLKWKNLRQL